MVNWNPYGYCVRSGAGSRLATILVVMFWCSACSARDPLTLLSVCINQSAGAAAVDQSSETTCDVGRRILTVAIPSDAGSGQLIEAGVPRAIAETIEEGKEGQEARICVGETLDASKATTSGTRKTAQVQCVASPAGVDHVMVADSRLIKLGVKRSAAGGPTLYLLRQEQ